MKYLIVSVYDSGYRWSICDNGKEYSRYSEEIGPIPKKIKTLINYIQNWTEANDEKSFSEFVKAKDYNIVVWCEDGDIWVVH